MKLWDGTEWKGKKMGEQGGYLRSYEAELADFASAVLHGTPPAAPAEYALGELRLALAMYRSADERPLGKGLDMTGVTFDFGGARVLVTGGTSGIGLAIAHAFVDAGAVVTITGTRATRDDVRRRPHGVRVSAVPHDRARRRSTQSARASTRSTCS